MRNWWPPLPRARPFFLRWKRNVLATWSCSARLIRLCLIPPQWRSCHERSIWRDQLEPAEEGVRSGAPIFARTLPRRLYRCRLLAEPKRDGRDAADPRAWNRCILASERGAVHRPSESIGSSFSSIALQPPASGRHDVSVGLGTWRLCAIPVSHLGECESSRQSVHQHSAVRQCRRFSLSGSGFLRADHSLSDGCHEP